MTQLGASFDLLAAYGPPSGAFIERRGVGAASAGVGARASTSDALDALRALRTGKDAVPHVAVGALPFARPTTATLSVGARTVARAIASDPWRMTEIGDVKQAFERVKPGSPSEGFRPAELHERPERRGYADAVGAAVTRIRSGHLRKVVLARAIDVDAGRVFDPKRLAHRLRAVNPDAYTFAVPTAEGTLVGASPELLVSRHGDAVRSNPLAGSAPRSGDIDEDRANAEALRASAKNLEEHAIVVEAVAQVLEPLCEELTWDAEPVLLETPNVWHLSTRFRGRLRAPAPDALTLALALHPTPAIGGAPAVHALQTIGDLEPFDRGSYAGPVGWVDANGDGEWAIALRCALLVGTQATLFAGAGIVADSDPWGEVDETERKFGAFLDALRWG